MVGSSLAQALREALTVDRHAFLPLRGLRAATSVTLALAVGIAVGQPAAGVLATVGALTAGAVSLTQGARTPYGTMAFCGLATALSAAVGTLSAHALPVELVALFVWGALAGLLAGAGPAAGVIGVQAVVGLVVLGRFPMSWHGALAVGGEVLLGSLLQLLVCGLVRPPRRNAVERVALAALAESLSGWAADPGGAWTSPTAARLEEARSALDRRGDAPSAGPLRSVQLVLGRSRLEISVLSLMAERDPVRGARVGPLLDAAAVDLSDLAGTLRSGQLGDAPGDRSLAPVLAADDGPDDLVAHRARALAGQLRGARTSLSSWADSHTAPADLLSAARARRPEPVWAALRHPSPGSFRHAARLSLLLPLAELLARVLPVQRGYWVALTAVVVLKPDYATSVKRGLGRVVGTLLGVVPISLVVGATHPRGVVLVVLVGLLAWGAYASFQAGFALYSALLAAFVVVLLDVVTPGGPSVAGARAVDTLIGGALALGAFLLLPAWEGPALPEAVSRLLHAVDRYAAALLAAYGTAPPERAELAARAQAVRLARTAAEASLGRVALEPSRTGSAQRVMSARGVLSGTARVTASLHVLHADAVEGVASQAPARALATFAAAVHDALDLAAVHVRQPTSGRTAPDLRTAAAELLTDGPDVLCLEAEELVDAVDTLLFATGIRADRSMAA